MRLMHPQDSNALVNEWLDDLPRRVLMMLCSSSGLSEGAVVGGVTRWLPSSINEDAIRDRCVSSIRWFAHHGDIASCGNRRYGTLPPYGILQVDKTESAVIRVFGNPHKDGDIASLARLLHGEFESTYVPWYWQERYRNVHNVGWQRHALVPRHVISDLVSSLREIGVRVVDPTSIRDNLPSIHAVLVPPKSVFQAHLPTWGTWAQYQPLLLSHDRWESVDPPLVPKTLTVYRWLPSRDLAGDLLERYFLGLPANAHSKDIAEISRSSARMWMFFLDHQADNPRSMSVENGVAIIPSELPDPHRHWLELSSSRWFKEGPMRRYELATDAADVINTLHATLGWLLSN